jgi:Mrp family chromosome partitioning ATPase
MRELILEWRRNFDYIIVDTPPVLLAADAVRLSVEADLVILVIRSGYATQEALPRAGVALAAKRLSTGIVLNAVDLRSPEITLRQ